MANIGRLTVDLRLVSQKFNAGLKSAQGSLQKFRVGAASVTQGLGGMQARIAGLVGVAGLGALVRQSLNTVDALAKTSDRLGITTEALSGLQFAAQQTGASTEAMNMGLQRMTRRLGQVAATGKGEAAVALERLGISIEDIKSLAPEQQFAMIAEKMKGVATQGEKVFITQKLFDSEGVKLLNTLDLGADGLEKMITQAGELGIAVNRVDAAKIEAANDAINSAQKAIQGASNTLTVEMAPIIKAVADNFVTAATEGGGFGETIKNVFAKAVGAVGIFADGIHGIKVVVKAVETALYGFGTVWANIMNYIVNDVITPAVNKIRETLNAPLREVLEFGAKLPVVGDKAKEMLDKLGQVGKSEGIESIRNLAGQMTAKFNEKKEELQELMLETIPSEAMKEKIAEIYEEAAENGKEIAQQAAKAVAEAKASTPMPEDEESNDQKVADEKSYLDRLAALQTGHSKKLTAIKKSMAMKTAVMNMWTGVSEGVKLGWPMAIPAVAFALAEGAVAISSIRSAGSYEGGGYTGAGTRVGGVDGRGGMPAIVHPNEQIIDLSKGQSAGGMTFNFSPQIIGDFDEMAMQSLQRRSKQFTRMVTAAVNNNYA